MNFNLDLDDKLGMTLAQYAEKTGISRNSLIRKAIDDFIKKRCQNWPDEVLNFKGIPDFPAFEADRSQLLDPQDWF